MGNSEVTPNRRLDGSSGGVVQRRAAALTRDHNETSTGLDSRERDGPTMHAPTTACSRYAGTGTRVAYRCRRSSDRVGCPAANDSLLDNPVCRPAVPWSPRAARRQRDVSSVLRGGVLARHGRGKSVKCRRGSRHCKRRRRRQRCVELDHREPLGPIGPGKAPPEDDPRARRPAAWTDRGPSR